MLTKIIKLIILLGLLVSNSLCIYAQNKSEADKLEQEFLTKNLSLQEQMETLAKLAQDSPDFDKGLLYSEKLLQLARSVDSTRFVLQALTQKGNALTRKGNLSLALEVYLEGIDLAKTVDHKRSLGANYVAIAGVYSIMDNKENTILYYRKAIDVLKNVLNVDSDKRVYASALENLGDEYNLNFSQPDSALYYFEQSGKIFQEIDYKLGLAYNLGNKGLAFAQLQQTDLAEANIIEAIELLTDLGDYYAISVYLTYMSDIYLEKGDHETAHLYAQSSLEMAKKHGLKEQIGDAYLKLSQIAESENDAGKALQLYKNHIEYRDSFKSISVAQQMARQRRESDLKGKQNEIEILSLKEEKQREIVIATAIGLLLIGLLAFGLYRRTLFISKTKKIIETERNRSDELLLNILPEQTAEELKTSGKVKAKKFDSVSVLFSDFEGFTSYAENISPELLVESLGFYFSEFDKITEKYGLEKIKTIGDAYMCASGLPFSTTDHAQRITKAALEMITFVASVKSNNARERDNFDIRIGISSGPVIAGVVGSKKFAYDIWGDTVNVASRMESMGHINQVNISETTHELIHNQFKCEYRGEFEVKNKGALKMYFVTSEK